MESMQELIELARRMGTNASGQRLSPRLRGISEGQFQETYGVAPQALRSVASSGGSGIGSFEAPPQREISRGRMPGSFLSEARADEVRQNGQNFGATLRAKQQPQAPSRGIHPDMAKLFSVIFNQPTPQTTLRPADWQPEPLKPTFLDVNAGQSIREALARPGAGGRLRRTGSAISRELHGGVRPGASTRATGMMRSPAEQVRETLGGSDAGGNLRDAGQSLEEMLNAIVDSIMSHTE